MTPYLLAILAASVLYAAVAWRSPRQGLFLLAAALPSYLLRFDVGPVPMTLLEVLALVLVVAWVARAGSKEPILEALESNRAFLTAAGLLLLAATVAVFVAPDRLSALGIWKAYFLEPIAVFAVASDVLRRNPEDRGRLLAWLGAGGLFVACVTVAQWASGLGIPVPWDIERRATGMFPYPNAVGLYLGPIVMIAVARQWCRGAMEPRERGFWIAVAIAGAAAIALAQSEAAVVSLVATALVAGLVRRKTRAFSVALFAAMALFVLLSPTASEKLTFNDYSGQVRRSQWAETIAMLRDHPIFGSGLNGYPAAMAPYHRATQYEIFQYPHTVVLNVWTELGALGLVACAALALVVFREVLPAWKSARPGASDPRIAAALALLQMTIHGLADVPYFKNDLSMMVWILLAVIASASYGKSSRSV